MKRKLDNGRIERAIAELVKIAADGHSRDELVHIMYMLRTLANDSEK